MNVTACDWPYCNNLSIKTVSVEFVSKPFDLSLCENHLNFYETIHDCWKRLTGTKGFEETYLLFGLSVDILRSAMMALGSGNIYGSALLSRSALEGALHARLRVTCPQYDNSGGRHHLYTFKPDTKWDSCKLAGLIERCKKDNYLSADLYSKSRNVKDWGDYIAHMSQKQSKSPLDFSRVEKHEGYDLVWWPVTEEEARHSIEHSTEILSDLIKDFYETTRPRS